MQNSNLVTVIICTYKRPELLGYCLKSLALQTASQDKFETLIIDNAGDRKTELVAEQFGARYIKEPVVGLSHARNRGWKESNTPWILYLDDDAKADKLLIDRLLTHIESDKFDMIGGRFTHWFISPPPKWIYYQYGPEGYRPCNLTTTGSLPPGCYLVGGVLAIKRPLVAKEGGFNVNLGMSGDRIGWAEEDELQDRFKLKGYQLGYDPEMIIDHLVQPYKYSISKQIQMAFASGRDGNFHGSKYGLGALSIDIIKVVFYIVPYDLARWLLRPGFYWQNVIVNSVGKLAFALGNYRNRTWQ